MSQEEEEEYNPALFSSVHQKLNSYNYNVEVWKTITAASNGPFSGSGAQKQTLEKIHFVCTKPIPSSLPFLSEAFTRAAHHINIALYRDLNTSWQHVFTSEWLLNTQETLNKWIYHIFIEMFWNAVDSLMFLRKILSAVSAPEEINLI